jgi:putative iron-dependent peroxidase
MLENMFIGRPPGNYDRILDFSRAITGSNFFVPTATFLDNVTDDEPTGTGVSSSAPPVAPEPPATPGSDGSLGIGSLKGETERE